MFVQALLLVALAMCAFAQNTTTRSGRTSSAAAAQTTMNLFLGNNANQEFVGSVINADACGTTYAIACTEGSYSLASGFSGSCNPASTARVTYGPNSYEISIQTQISGVEATLLETCSLVGTTEAACYVSVYASADGTDTSSTISSTLTGDQVSYRQVPITAGASKMANLGTCTEAANAAAATGVSQVYKILVIPGAAALLAGALV